MHICRMHAALEEIAGALHHLGQGQVGDRVFELIGTRADPDDALELVRVQWQAPQDATQLLIPSHFQASKGLVAECIVQLDVDHPGHDGGPLIRQATYDINRNRFFCPISGADFVNVTGWTLGATA